MMDKIRNITSTFYPFHSENSVDLAQALLKDDNFTCEDYKEVQY